MSINGIWKVEMLGPYGWEPMATAFLEDGKYMAASESHYTVGDYEVTDSRIEMRAVGVQYGKARTIFGKKEKQMGLEFKGKIDGDRIRGQTQDEQGKFQVTFRWVRIADLP